MRKKEITRNDMDTYIACQGDVVTRENNETRYGRMDDETCWDIDAKRATTGMMGVVLYNMKTYMTW